MKEKETIFDTLQFHVKICICNKEGVQSNALSSFLDVHHDFLLFVDGPCSPHIALKIQKNILQFIATIIKKMP